jgi:hypothetical protein
MKKALALIVLLTILAACNQQQLLEKRADEPAAEPTPEPAVIAQTPEPAVIVETPEEEAEELPVLDDGTAERLAQEQAEKVSQSLETVPKATPTDRTTIVEQMYETYKGLESYQVKTFEGAYFVRGEKVRFLPRNAIRMLKVTFNGKDYRDVYIDEIIFDREEKMATGYCFGYEEDTNQQCAHFELYDLPFPLVYTEHMRKLPDEWVREYLNKVPTNEEYEKYYVNDMETTRVHFPDGVQMFFNPRAGLPVWVLFPNDEKTVYDDMVINRVRPEDVIHRSRKDIPPAELFHRTNY